VTKCLLDGDIGVYRVGFASQDVEVNFAYARMNKWIEDILKANDTMDYKVYLTSEDKSNFRFGLYPEYKANRKIPKPLWYGELRAHLIADHPTEVIAGREADDAMADNQTADSVICSIDKDLDQISGEHYDFVKDVRYSVSRERGLRFFYYQLLTGDRTDNVPGVEGIGPKKAEGILAGVEPNELSLFKVVRGVYHRSYGKRGDELMLLYGRLLKIGGDLWAFPEGGEVEDTEVDSKDLSEIS
jgi:DNA polymerase-1